MHSKSHIPTALRMGDLALQIYAYKDKWSDNLLKINLIPNSWSPGMIGHLFLDFVEESGGLCGFVQAGMTRGADPNDPISWHILRHPCSAHYRCWFRDRMAICTSSSSSVRLVSVPVSWYPCHRANRARKDCICTRYRSRHQLILRYPQKHPQHNYWSILVVVEGETWVELESNHLERRAYLQFNGAFWCTNSVF